MKTRASRSPSSSCSLASKEPIAPGRWQPTGAGRQLPCDTRQSMERSFGADFRSVRIHEDELAADLGAIAVARGDDVHFAPGAFQPGTPSGREVIGHELAHVVQQRQGRVSAPMQAKGLPTSADPALEAEADDLGRRAAAGERVAGAEVPAHAKGAPVAQCLRDTNLGMETDVEIDRLPLKAARNYLAQLGKPPPNLTVEAGDLEALQLRIAKLQSLQSSSSDEDEDRGSKKPKVDGSSQDGQPDERTGEQSSEEEEEEEQWPDVSDEERDQSTSGEKLKEWLGSLFGDLNHIGDEDAIEEYFRIDELLAAPKEDELPEIAKDIGAIASWIERSRKHEQGHDESETGNEEGTEEALGQGYEEEYDEEYEEEYEEEYDEELGAEHLEEGVEQLGENEAKGFEEDEEEIGSQRDNNRKGGEELFDSSEPLSKEEQALVLPSAKGRSDRMDGSTQIRTMTDRNGTVQSGTSVITETFSYTDDKAVTTTRRRQIEVRIPFSTLRGQKLRDLSWCEYHNEKNQKKACSKGTATPISLLHKTGKKGDKNRNYKVDRTFDPDGLYEKGHLLPHASGAPHNAWMTTPMTARTNKEGEWKDSERAIDRMLQVPHGNKSADLPQDDEETRIAKLTHAPKKKKKLGTPLNDMFFSGYKKVQLFYKGADPRVPSSFVVSLHDKTGRCFKVFPEISNDVIDVEPRLPSEGMGKLLTGATDLLHKADERVQQQGTGQNEWEPLDWDQDEKGKQHPPTQYPESHVPRPHRVLDFLLKRGDLTKSIEGALDKLREEVELTEEEQELLMALEEDQPQRGKPFSSEQRHLAELHVRHENEGKYVSDLAPSRNNDLSKLSEQQKGVYTEVVGNTELGRGKGHLAPDADHHTTAANSGTNHFTNMLMVSHKQNLRAEAHNKPADLTNPHRMQRRDKDEEESEDKKPASKVQEHKPNTVKHGFNRPKTKEVEGKTIKMKDLDAKGYDNLFSGENAEPYTEEELIAEAKKLPVEDKDLPWSTEQRDAKKENKKLLL